MDQQALGSKYWSLITGIRCLISIDIYRWGLAKNSKFQRHADRQPIWGKLELRSVCLFETIAVVVASSPRKSDTTS